MQEDNPYSAPSAELAEVHGDGPVQADRLMRFLAWILDALIQVLVVLPVLLAFVISGGLVEAVMSGRISLFNLGLGLLIGTFLSFLLIQAYPLYTRGQTWGKMALKLKIVDMAGHKPEFFKLVGLRYLVVHVVANVPVVGIFILLADLLFIFGDARRCLHDYLAGTQVVAAA